MDNPKIEYINLSKIKPYEKNPRKNDKAVDIVAASINEFGFKNPIILDSNMEIIAGHIYFVLAIWGLIKWGKENGNYGRSRQAGTKNTT